MLPPDPTAESSAEERFIELATRPLENHPAVREEARNELAGRLHHASSADQENQLDAALHQLEKAAPSPSRLAFATCCILWLILGVIAAFQGHSALKDARRMNITADRDLQGLVAHLSPQDQKFVLARRFTNDIEMLDALEHLKDLHPKDPGLYEEYISKRLQIGHGLPPDYRETWQRLDPDNGIWPLFEAGIEAKAAGSGGSFNPARFENALALFEEAARAKSITRNLHGLWNRRMALLEETQDYPGELDLLALGNELTRTGRIPDLYDALIGFMRTRTTQLSAAKDEGGLRRFIASWKRLTDGMVGSFSTTSDVTDFSSFFKWSYLFLGAAARDLGMAEEASALNMSAATKPLGTAFRRRTDHRIMDYHTGGYTTINPGSGDIDPALFEPGRRMEYAMIDRGTAVSAAILLLVVLAGALAESQRRGKRVNGLAAGLTPLFWPADILWCLGLGIAVPVIYYLATSRLTPLGCRDWGAIAAFDSMSGHWMLLPAFIQPVAALLLLLCMLVQTLRWRIARRMSFLALGPPWRWTGWLPPLVAALVLPLSGIARWIPAPEDWKKCLIATAAAAGLPLLWLLWQALAGLFARGDRALGGVLLSRRLVPPLTFLSILLLAAWPALRHQERQWFQRNGVSRADRAHGGLTKWEVRTVEWMSNQYRAALKGLK